MISLTPRIIRDLGEGLIVRHATSEDIPALEEMSSQIFGRRASAWMRHLVRGDSPVCGPDSFVVVEDTASHQIVSSVDLIAQHWWYEGVPLRVGQPEFVLTRPEYRRKGLIRAQFEAIHRMSEERGDHLQAITGIPFYYRQFGYEMTLPLGGARIGMVPFIPKLKEEETEAYFVRPATYDDLPFITTLYADNIRRRSMVANGYSEAEWRYILDAWEGEPYREELKMITNAAEERVGFILHHSWLRPMYQLAVGAFELVAGISWQPVTAAVLRHLATVGEALAVSNRERAATLEQVDQRLRDTLEFSFINFWLGATHPAYDAMPSVFGPEAARTYNPYGWYIRVADLPAFLRHIQPVLERRLADSILAGFSGDYKLGFYRTGLVLTFEQGRLSTIAPFTPESEKWGDVAFPNQTFLHVLFGHHTVDELNAIFPDCYAENDIGKAMTSILFPKRTSVVQSWSSDG